MGIQVEACEDPYCEGALLSINDRGALAKAVALVLAQQYSAAVKVTMGEEPTVGGLRIDADVIIAERLKTVGRDGRPSAEVRRHRDGLLFQLVAWLAACVSADPTDHVQRPHLIKATKGIDAGIVHFGSGAALAAVSICEDKATINPRNKIQQKVWPEIEACERGEKDDELRTFAIDALIRRGLSDDDAEAAAGAILWSGRRRYRIRTTVGRTHKDPPERGKLFKGFEELAPGDRARRRGETLFLEELRPWMNDFAELVASELRDLEAALV